MLHRTRVIAVHILILAHGVVRTQPSPEIAATAGAGSAISTSPWAALHNPATLPFNGVPTLAMWGEPFPFGLPGLATGGVAFYTMTRNAGVVIAFRGTDYDLYHDIGADGALALELEKDLAVGLRVGAQALAVGEVLRLVPSIAIGLQLQASPDLRLAGFLNARHEAGRPVEQSMELAGAFAVDRGTTMVGALTGSTRGDQDAAIGLMITASDAVTLFGGLAAVNGRFAIGTAITRGPFVVHVAVVSTSSIGIKSVVGVITPL